MKDPQHGSKCKKNSVELHTRAKKYRVLDPHEIRVTSSGPDVPIVRFVDLFSFVLIVVAFMFALLSLFLLDTFFCEVRGRRSRLFNFNCIYEKIVFVVIVVFRLHVLCEVRGRRSEFFSFFDTFHKNTYIRISCVFEACFGIFPKNSDIQISRLLKFVLASFLKRVISGYHICLEACSLRFQKNVISGYHNFWEPCP